jgi:hypothetical protein
MISSGLEPATFWLAAQCLNQLYYSAHIIIIISSSSSSSSTVSLGLHISWTPRMRRFVDVPVQTQAIQHK